MLGRDFFSPLREDFAVISKTVIVSVALVLPALLSIATAGQATHKDVIVMAMHGGIPHDFPHEEMMVLYSGDCLKKGMSDSQLDSLEAVRHAIEEKMKDWPRTEENDSYYFGSQRLGEALAHATGTTVLTCFNEYCAPDVPTAIDSAVALGATRVFVVTPMMTPGGGHSERDIPSSITAAQGSYPQIPIVYAWPFEVDAIAEFLAGHMETFRSNNVSAR